MIVDSHCHLDFPDLYNQLDNIVNRAKLNNIKHLLTICTNLESFEKIKLIVPKYKNIYGTFGIHPHETSKSTHVDLNFILSLKKNFKKIIGIGETGLDFYYNYSDKNIQKKSFINHIHAASELNMPVIVHSRNAETEMFDILKSEKKNCDLKVLLHCFTGSLDFAKKLLDLNCYISISGIITFNNANELRETVAHIPIDNLLVETDSPYLAPIPFRGKPNEPSYIVHTIEKISEIKKLSTKEICDKTTNNFNKLFNIL
jgi:TatD DNase family protein